MGWLLVTAWLGLTGSTDARGARGEVVAEALDVYDSPSATAYAVARLHAGDTVFIRDDGPSGWLAIERPSSSFVWIDEAAVNVRERVAVVRAARATLRSGRADARMPGPPSAEGSAGTPLRLLDREPLRLRQGRQTRTWLAVEPPPGLLGFVRADGVERLGDGGSRTPAPRRAAPRGVDSSLLAIGSLAPAGLPAIDQEALGRVEEAHRRELRRALEAWDLASVRAGYQSLRERGDSPTLGPVLDERLERLDAQQAAADAARRFLKRLQESRRADGNGAPDADVPPEPREPYDASGLLEPSSKLVEGQRVFALIGPEGFAVAYLRPVPGVEARRYVGRRVGVRGPARYDETLRVQVITVQGLEPLAGPP